MNLWMVRAASGGRLADEFVDKGLVAMGATRIGSVAGLPDKQAFLDLLQKLRPEMPSGKRQSSASQLIRFRDEVQRGDRVITYDAGRRIYHVGEITSDYQHRENVVPDFHHFRTVRWDGDVERDALSTRARNTLGSTLTLFRIPEEVAEEIITALEGRREAAPAAAVSDEGEDEEALLQGYREQATEIIKDRINRLDPRELEELVAGVLRAMGYKTRVSPPGSDLAMDILASPDGFGFESPRIIVEVKHRSKASDSKEIRNLVGGRHASDKGLFVSTGGFTKDARYEADRANIPLMLWDLHDLVQALVENYDNADQETRTLVPLTRLFWPI